MKYPCILDRRFTLWNSEFSPSDSMTWLDLRNRSRRGRSASRERIELA
jgi:hypothetical protein